MKDLSGKRILCLDYGEKVIGTALFAYGVDPYPLPYERIINQGFEETIKTIRQIIDDEVVDILVIGVPYLLDGSESTQTKNIKKINQKIFAQFSDIACFEQDETLSSFEAGERMKNSARYNFQIDLKQIDSLSAAIILEDFIKRIEDENH